LVTEVVVVALLLARLGFLGLLLLTLAVFR